MEQHEPNKEGFSDALLACYYRYFCELSCFMRKIKTRLKKISHLLLSGDTKGCWFLHLFHKQGVKQLLPFNTQQNKALTQTPQTQILLDEQ